MGKCVDLESAYKQCPVAQKHSHVSVSTLRNPESGEVDFFEACALPFGATAAVHGLNWCATALNHTAHHVIAAPCSHYFDDFTLIAPKALGERMSETVIALFEILVWKVKKEKGLPMEEVVVALGVKFDLRKCHTQESCFQVTNKKPCGGNRGKDQGALQNQPDDGRGSVAA